MSWRRARSHCRREFWLTDKRRHVWRWISACLPRLAPDPWSGRASWPWSPKSSRDPSDLNPAQKWVSFTPQNTGVYTFQARKLRNFRQPHHVWLFSEEPEPEDVKRVELRVPRTADLPGLWSVSQYSPCLLLSLPARLLGFTSPSLWMLSVCLAEIEKHKGDLHFDPKWLIIWLLKARFCSVLLHTYPLFEDLIDWSLIAVSCLQVFKSSRRRSASLRGSNILRRCLAEWPSSLGRRPTVSVSTCTITEETRHKWRDSSLGHDHHQPFWSSFMQTYSGPSPPYILSGPPYLMVPPVLE